ncbi:SCO6880 family protein [Streptomyces sp. NPDC096032]|uniref:SCO6880 family protein n=1 Tax=Streptomyces sp. NPDC096032 TaxID=3366070 RepID=UPI00381742E9
MQTPAAVALVLVEAVPVVAQNHCRARRVRAGPDDSARVVVVAGLVRRIVLLPLLEPGRFQRRITLAYRVLDPHEGEAVLEREISNAHQRAQVTAETKGRAKWSRKADAQRAEHAAAQMAGGSQVVDWTLMVTVTARSADELPAVRQELERVFKATRGIRMRPAYGAQAAVFAAGLPLGYNPLVRD